MKAPLVAGRYTCKYRWYPIGESTVVANYINYSKAMTIYIQ